MGLEFCPITQGEAFAFIAEHHRHHGAPVGSICQVAVANGDKIVGVVVVGRPVARGLQDGWTAEVTRCCTDGTKNACSKLYSAAWRAARALGYRKLVTYVLSEESGTSLSATGWKSVAETKGGSWNCVSRPRVDKHPLQAKIRWEVKSG